MSFMLIPNLGILGAATAYLLGMTVAAMITISLYWMVYRHKLSEPAGTACAEGSSRDLAIDSSDLSNSEFAEDNPATQLVVSNHSTTHVDAKTTVMPVTEGGT